MGALGRSSIAAGAWRVVAAAATVVLLAGCRYPQAARPPAAGGPTAAMAARATVAPATTLTIGPAGATVVTGAPSVTATAVVVPPAPDSARLRLVPYVTGLDDPVEVQPVGRRPGRLAVVEKAGRVRLVVAGVLSDAPLLDIRGRVGSSGSEQGLLGLAFHPGFGRGSGEDRFYVNYTDRDGDTVLAEYRVSDDPDRADPAGGRTLLTVEQPAANHNGGHLAFGPDGYLYVGLGDGGGAGDRYGNARNPDTWLGKILRIDVDVGAPYGVPSDNPFLDQPDWRPEIWAWGLRNPWKLSFDRVTGDLYVADVGQGDWEEVNFQPAGAPGGQDYGWPLLEGNHCYGADAADCDAAGDTVRPVAEYAHADGNCSVTGGYVYRGRAIPALVGAYLFGDYCSGRLWAAWRAGDGAWRSAELADSEAAISAFGQDLAGELYVVDYADGALLRLAVAPDGFGATTQTPPAKRPVGSPAPRTE